MKKKEEKNKSDPIYFAHNKPSNFLGRKNTTENKGIIYIIIFFFSTFSRSFFLLFREYRCFLRVYVYLYLYELGGGDGFVLTWLNRTGIKLGLQDFIFSLTANTKKTNGSFGIFFFLRKYLILYFRFAAGLLLRKKN